MAVLECGERRSAGADLLEIEAPPLAT
jgi:hypothetical protein